MINDPSKVKTFNNHFGGASEGYFEMTPRNSPRSPRIEISSEKSALAAAAASSSNCN